jgi:hypothetical protein
MNWFNAYIGVGVARWLCYFALIMVKWDKLLGVDFLLLLLTKGARKWKKK